MESEQEAAKLLAELRRAKREMIEASDSDLWSLASPLETVVEYRKRMLEMYEKLINLLEMVTV